MNNDTKNRQPKGVPVGGQFAATTHAEPSLNLGAPQINPRWVGSQLSAMGYGDLLGRDQGDELVQRLNDGRDFSDDTIRRTAESIHLRDNGYDLQTAVSVGKAIRTLRHVGASEQADAVEMALTGRAGAPGAPPAAPVPDGVTIPMPADDPRVQSGEVFEKVIAEGTVFTHADATSDPDGCQSMRFQADRPLTDEEAYALSGAVGYANRAAIGGEPLDNPATGPTRDSPCSFIVHIDTTKGRRRNYDAFEEMVPDIIAHGSAPRSTQGGTRAIEPFGHVNLNIYYGE